MQTDAVIKRAVNGLETKFFDDVLEGKASQDIERGTSLSWKLVKKHKK